MIKYCETFVLLFNFACDPRQSKDPGVLKSAVSQMIMLVVGFS
jgi:hypothetical protein